MVIPYDPTNQFASIMPGDQPDYMRQTGILGQVQQQGQPLWQKGLGILGASLQDTGAALDGRPGGNLNNFNRNSMLMDSQQRRQMTIKKVQDAYARGDMNAVRAAAMEDPEFGASLLGLLKQDAPKFHEVGGALYELPSGPGGKPTRVVDAPVKPAEAPKSRTVRRGGLEVTEEWNPADGTWKEIGRGAAWKPETGGESSKPPPGYRWGPDNNLQAIPGGPADSTGKNSKATDTQRVTALYADRAREAENILSGEGGVEGQGTSLGEKALSSIPGVGNYLVSDDFQKYDQARRNFVNAVLRKESGAVISPEEFGNAEKQYFPQPGDTAQVLAQKRANRETAIEGLHRAAGTAMNPQGEPARSAAAPSSAPATEQPAQTPRPSPLKPQRAVDKLPRKAQAGAPTVGAVVKGYRFKGGNPASPSSWEKV